MTSSIAGDEPPHRITAHANVSHASAVDEQARQAPNLTLKLEVGDASAVNNLSGVPAPATASQQGAQFVSTAAAAAAGADHAGKSPAQDPVGHGSAIAQDQQAFDVKAISNGGTMPDSSPSYPITIQPAQALDLPTVHAISGQAPHANGTCTPGSAPESNATGATETQDGQVSEGVTQMEVDATAAAAAAATPAAAPSPKKELPAFVQTSALISNSCGYCGTRSTSGCWRRGWEIGNGKFINLCNKCGLRHKAGKLHSVPQPTPSTQRRGGAAAAASPSRVISKTNPAAAAGTAANALTAAEREAAAANAAAAVAAAAGLPGASTGDLLRSMMHEQQQQQQQQRQGGGSSSSLSSLLAVVAANAAAAAAGGDGSSGNAAAAAGGSGGGSDDLQGLSAKQKLAVLLESLGFKTEGSGGYVNGDISHHRDQVPRRSSSNIPRFGDHHSNGPAAAAAMNGGYKAADGSGHIDGLPDFNAAAGSSRSSIPASAAVSAFLAAAEAAGGSSTDIQGFGSDLGCLNGVHPDLIHYLSGLAAADEPAPKRRRTKNTPGRLLLPAAAPAAAASTGQSRSAAAAAAALEREESLAVGAADALLTLNRSSPSGSPCAGSPTTIHPAAETADEHPPTVPFDQAAAAAAAEKAATAAERAAAATAAARVDAAASIAGWSPGPGNTNMLEAFLSGALPGALLKKTKSGNVSGAAAAAAAGGGRSSSKGPADHHAMHGGFKQQQQQLLSRQVTTSPNALRPGTHSLQPQPTTHQNPNTTNNTTPTPRNNNLAGLTAAAAAAPIAHNAPGSGNYSNVTGSGNYAHLTPAFSVRNWSLDKIYAWLHATGCNEAVRVFRDLDIDGLALAGLVRVAGADAARLHDVLKNDLGVQHVGLRLRLVEAMAALFAGDGV